MDVEVGEGDFDLNLFTKEDGSGGLTMHYDHAAQRFTVDKSKMDKRFNEKVFEQVYLPALTPLKTMQVFIDHSSIEVFVNGGETTFTAHIYPTEREHFYTISDNGCAKVYELEASVKDDFVV